MTAMKTDSLFYRLFQRCPQLAMELLGLDFSGDSYAFGSEEIKQTGFRLDGVFKPLTENPNQPLIFAEVQYQPDEDFYARFLTEITLYLYRHKPNRTWLALVIYPTRTTEKPPSVEFEPFMALPALRRIYLEDYQHGELSFNLTLVRLIACDEKQTAGLVHQLVSQTASISLETLNFIETILVYKLPRLSREEIRAMLNVQNIELKQTQFYQDVFQECELNLLQRGLISRFGALPPNIQQRLMQANAKQLEQWVGKLFTASTLEAIFDEALH
jgi:predicted transposase/invertase (TIGR01784 family)